MKTNKPASKDRFRTARSKAVLAEEAGGLPSGERTAEETIQLSLEAGQSKRRKPN